jgi:hypothetical protein
METEQMMARLLAEMRTGQEHTKEMMKEMKDEIKEDMNANRKADRENLQEMMKEMMNDNQAKTSANIKEMREEIKFGQAEMQSIVNAWIANMRVDRKETVSCQVTTEPCLDSKELNPEDRKSEVEHRDVPKEDAIVISVKGRKKRQRDGHQAAGRRVEPKELTRGDCGSQRKLAAACRKVSRRVAVARSRRNIFGKLRAQGNCGPRKELAAAGREVTRCAEVARRKGRGLQGRSHEGPSVEQGRRKNQTRNKFARGTRKGRTLARRQLMLQEAAVEPIPRLKLEITGRDRSGQATFKQRRISGVGRAPRRIRRHLCCGQRRPRTD